MAIRCDLSDVKKQLARAPIDVMEMYKAAGELATDYAKQYGDYQNRTGNLRSSNKYYATPRRLVLYNDAEYASNVEAKGYDVLSGAFLQLMNLLK